MKNEAQDLEKILEAHDLGDQIKKVLARIPEKYREVIVLCMIQGHTYEEAAKILKCKRSVVSMRLSRARAHFIKMMKKMRKRS